MNWLKDNWWWIVFIICVYVLGASVGWEVGNLLKEGLR